MGLSTRRRRSASARERGPGMEVTKTGQQIVGVHADLSVSTCRRIWRRMLATFSHSTSEPEYTTARPVVWTSQANASAFFLRAADGLLKLSDDIFKRVAVAVVQDHDVGAVVTGRRPLFALIRRFGRCARRAGRQAANQFLWAWRVPIGKETLLAIIPATRRRQCLKSRRAGSAFYRPCSRTRRRSSRNRPSVCPVAAPGRWCAA